MESSESAAAGFELPGKEDDNAMENAALQPSFDIGSKVEVTIIEGTKGALVVELQVPNCTFRGVLLDATNGVKPNLIRQSESSTEQDDSAKSTYVLHELENKDENIGSSTQLRQTYQQETDADVNSATLSSSTTSSAYQQLQKKQRIKPRLLRPRLMLCTLCKARCYERNTDTSGGEGLPKTSSSVLKVSSKSSIEPDNENIQQRKVNKRKATVVERVEIQKEEWSAQLAPTVPVKRYRDPYEFFDDSEDDEIERKPKSSVPTLLFIAPEGDIAPTIPSLQEQSTAQSSKLSKPRWKKTPKLKTKPANSNNQSGNLNSLEKDTDTTDNNSSEKHGKRKIDQSNRIQKLKTKKLSKQTLQLDSEIKPKLPEVDTGHNVQASENQNEDLAALQEKKDYIIVKPENIPIRLKNRNVQIFDDRKGRRLSIGDVIWGKIVGFPWWPGRVCTITVQENEHGVILDHVANIDWYGSPTVSNISCSLLYPFLDHFESRIDKKKKTKSYTNAIAEAKLDACLNAQLSENYSDSGVPSVSPTPPLPYASESVIAGAQSEDIRKKPVDELDFSHPESESDHTIAESEKADNSVEKLTNTSSESVELDSRSVLIDAFLRTDSSSVRSEQGRNSSNITLNSSSLVDSTVSSEVTDPAYLKPTPPSSPVLPNT